MDAILKSPPAIQDSTTIDKEHQVQLGLLDAFHTLIEKDEDLSRIKEMLNQLISYSEIHFMSEQLLMRNYAYPDYGDHVQDHESMMERLNQIKRSVTSGQKNTTLGIANEMRNFLLGHISSRDQAFTDFLTKAQST